MRALVWNVAGAVCSPETLGALGLGADVYMLNEARVPEGIHGAYRPATIGRDGKRRPWSAAVLSEHQTREVTDAQSSWRGRVRNVPFESSRSGAWAVAQVFVDDHPAVTVVSLYGLLDEFADASMHRSLSEISPLVDDRRYSERLLIGGDFNVGTQWPAKEARWNKRDGGVLDRLRSWGMVDCVDRHRLEGRLEGCPCTSGVECRHVRTRRDRRWPEVPYQADYLFASPALAERLVACEVLGTDAIFARSDHAPIVAELALG